MRSHSAGNFRTPGLLWCPPVNSFQEIAELCWRETRPPSRPRKTNRWPLCGHAKITVAVRGTNEAREVVMMHIRPVAPATFEPVTLGKLEPWIWERATTW